MSSSRPKYNNLIVIDNKLTRYEAGLFLSRYIKLLYKLGARRIVVRAKKKFKSTYLIKGRLKVKYIGFIFRISPGAVRLYTKKLALDETTLRFFIERFKY